MQVAMQEHQAGPWLMTALLQGVCLQCRVLLNKCQEEFEAGDQAMAAVDAREKAAAAKVAAGEVH